MKMLKVFSRQLLGLGLFLGGSFMLNAQADLAMANIDEAIPAIEIDAHNAYSMDHTREALGQVSQHISDHIEYPEFLKQLQVGGRVVVELRFNDQGQLVKSFIVQKATESLNNAVMESLSTFDSVQLKGTDYKGVHTVHIPIEFTQE